MPTLLSLSPCKIETLPFTTRLTWHLPLSSIGSSSDASLASRALNLLPCEQELVSLPLDHTKQLKILVSLATNTKPSIVRPIASELAIIKSRALLFSGCPAQAWACQLSICCITDEVVQVAVSRQYLFLNIFFLNPLGPLCSNHLPPPCSRWRHFALPTYLWPDKYHYQDKAPPVMSAWPAQIWTLFPESESLLLYP